MKALCLWLLSNIIFSFGFAQPYIHAHNDYQQTHPLTHALANTVFSLEADVYFTANRLLVAHNKDELSSAPTLDSLYLQPIIALFTQYHGRISDNKNYAPVLMIDIKEKGTEVLDQLVVLLQNNSFVFDRRLNPLAVQLVISGDRGPIQAWKKYAPLLLFDGRPGELYDTLTLSSVAFISDSYANYHNNADSIAMLVTRVHSQGKLLRLWGCPDTPASWKKLLHWGINILNTDKVEECRRYIMQMKTQAE